MKDAKRSVLIHTPYAVFNDYMYDTMKEITERVPVTMMINSVENGDNFFCLQRLSHAQGRICGYGHGDSGI